MDPIPTPPQMPGTPGEDDNTTVVAWALVGLGVFCAAWIGYYVALNVSLQAEVPDSHPLETELSEEDAKMLEEHLSEAAMEMEEEVSEVADTDAETKLYQGRWFDVNYPADFRVEEREVSNVPGFWGKPAEQNRSIYDGVAFVSPDGKVEFYAYSPLRNGKSVWEEVGADEVISAEKTATDGEGEYADISDHRSVKWVTIAHRDGKYSRSYERISEYYLDWLMGIKYATWADYERYKPQYLRFKKSLVQYTDH